MVSSNALYLQRRVVRNPECRTSGTRNVELYLRAVRRYGIGQAASWAYPVPSPTWSGPK